MTKTTYGQLPSQVVEIGGFLGLDLRTGPLPHGEASLVNSGRSALFALLKHHAVRSIWLPDYICDSVPMACAEANVAIRYYPIAKNLDMSIPEHLRDDEWLYVVNYFGIVGPQVKSAVEKHTRVIVDNAQAFFEPPIPNTATLYTCRKFFGIPDGGLVYPTIPIHAERGHSATHLEFLAGRIETSASQYFEKSKMNEARIAAEPLLGISATSEALLRGTDFSAAAASRTRNFEHLRKRLDVWNELTFATPEGPFAYPLLVASGDQLRRELIAANVYVARLWPNVFENAPTDGGAHRLAMDLLPLPVDQRYGVAEMDRVADLVERHVER